jgi:type I restriction enzyme S subunit
MASKPTVQLGEICKPQQWATIGSNELTETGYRVHGANCFIGYYSEANHMRDVVAVSCRGENTGNVIYIPGPSYVTGNAMCLDDLDESKADARWLCEFLKLRGLRDIISGSAQPQIIQKDLSRVKIALPPLAEQRKIAEILRTWDEAIETAEAELKAKQERKRWLMEALIDEGGVNCDTEKLRTKSLLKEITSMASGGTPKTSVPEYYGGSIPWVSISDMTSGGSYIYGSKTQITEEGLSNSSARIFKKGTVLFAMYASIGECRIAGLDLTTSQAILGITPGHSIRSEYLYYFLCRIKETAKSYGQTGTQANLNKGIVGDFEISLPTLEEQDRILDILKTCDEDVEKASMLISALCVQKRGLMQKLLTGEVRVAA